MPDSINIKFGQGAKPTKVSNFSKGVLSDILKSAKIKSCMITSTQRSPEDQARVMYDNLVFYGVTHQKKLYGPFGDKVIEVYVQLKKSGESASTIKNAMVRKVIELGPAKVSKHCADPDVVNVIDISPKSISDKESFQKAVSKDSRVSKFITPPTDPSYHLEINQPQGQVHHLHQPSPAMTADTKLELTSTQLEKIKKQKPIFENVEKHTGVPWEAVAAVWTRESFSVAPPHRPGGQFQFDPVPPKNKLKTMLRRFSDLPESEIIATVAKGVNDFAAAALFCACFMRMKIAPVITPDASDEVIKEAFWAYNGRAYGGADKSPYVMNGFDSEHMNMIIRGTLPNPHGSGRIKVETVDKRPGAFTVYQQLIENF